MSLGSTLTLMARNTAFRVLASALPRMALAASCVLGGCGAAWAQVGSDRYSSMVVEANSGAVLESTNADEPRHPASLTKLMTLHMLFEALRDRRVTFDEFVPVSRHAALMSPSKLGIVPGTRITVEEAILGLVTKSANDAAAAIGEMLGGDEDRFAELMTLRARALGMSRTTFRNASGLPDPDQWSTAHDLTILAHRLIADFPGFYSFFSTPSFRFHGRTILNHDHMLQTYPGADGLKTGYTIASGFNLVTSATHGRVRLIGVVMGAENSGERDAQMSALLDQGFARLEASGQRVAQPPPSRGPSLISSAQAAIVAAPAPPPSPPPPLQRPVAPAPVEPPARFSAALPAPPPPAARPPATRALVASLHPAPRVAWIPRFGVQVGAFPTEHAAREAALSARRLADVGEARIEPVHMHGKTVWRAQLGNLPAAEAQGICAVLIRHRQPCVVLHPEPGQLASN